MKRILLTLLAMILFSACSAEVIPTPIPELVVEEVFDQVMDNGKTFSSKDFFDAGFKEYKEYNVSKLTASTEAWYGFWGTDEDSVNYYELRFYPDHSTAVSEGTAFAEDATGEDAKLRRQDTMWRVGLPDRKRAAVCLDGGDVNPGASIPDMCGGTPYKYADYIIFNNVIMLCEGEDSNEAFKLCNDLIDLLSK
jgi:hypothetical protein